MATIVSPLGIYHAELGSVSGSPFGGNSGIIPFSASSLVNAQAVAQSLSTLLAMSVKLTALRVLMGGESVYTAAAQGGTVSAPAGTSFSAQ